MTIRPIIIHPDPRLKKNCDLITCFDTSLKDLSDDMFETMYNAPGIGLAASQNWCYVTNICNGLRFKRRKT